MEAMVLIGLSFGSFVKGNPTKENISNKLIFII